MAEMAIAAAAMQVVGGVVEGVEQNSTLRAQARVDEENARLGLLEGEQAVLATRRDERRQAGEMLASMGGTGLQLGGSMADVLAESAYQRELEIFNVRTRAAREAQGLNQAAADKRKAGRAAIVKSVFGAAATALNAVSENDRRNTMSSQWERERQVPRVALVGGQ